jgi:hypothetical protein
MAVFDWAGVDTGREEPNSGLATGSCSRSGTDASRERVRLWTSRRLWAVAEVPSLDVELSTCFGQRLDALRRANRTNTRMRATIKIKLPMLAMTIIARLLLFGDDDVVDDPEVCWRERGLIK